MFWSKPKLHSRGQQFVLTTTGPTAPKSHECRNRKNVKKGNSLKGFFCTTTDIHSYIFAAICEWMVHSNRIQNQPPPHRNTMLLFLAYPKLSKSIQKGFKTRRIEQKTQTRHNTPKQIPKYPQIAQRIQNH